MAIWHHPQLGEFKFDEDDNAYVRMVDLPAFTAFKYSDEEEDSEFALSFYTELEEEYPSESAASIADLVCKNQHQLAEVIKLAIWSDLNGEGKESGMWWHGDRNSVREMIAAGQAATGIRGPYPVDHPDDVFGLVGLMEIVVYEEIYLYENPIAKIAFAAAFDVEHGLSVLTNGKRVIGIGYEMDPTPFVGETVKRYAN